jgi:hypothetical protein
MNEALEIKIGIGLSRLVFGASMKEAENVFGSANETELIDDIEDCKTTVWYYSENGFTLFFEEESNHFLNCVDVENTESMLWGHRIFELKEKQIIELFKSKGILKYETEIHDWGEKRLSFDDLNIDFYFDKNQLISINYGKLIQDSQILILPN